MSCIEKSANLFSQDPPTAINTAQAKQFPSDLQPPLGPQSILDRNVGFPPRVGVRCNLWDVQFQKNDSKDSGVFSQATKQPTFFINPKYYQSNYLGFPQFRQLWEMVQENVHVQFGAVQTCANLVGLKTAPK